jgi:hypothetical protein
LLPTAVFIGKNEKPVIWFSSEQFWEPTAQKTLMSDPQRALGMQGTYEHGQGLARFGVSPARLVPWPRLAKLAEIPASHRRGLISAAWKLGAVPERWYGMVDQSMAVDTIDVIEIFDGKQWCNIRRRADEIVSALQSRAVEIENALFMQGFV